MLQGRLPGDGRGERDRLRAVMREDGRHVAVAEAPGIRGDGECLLDGFGAVQLGERDRLGELAPQLGRARRGGGDQPPLGARPDPKECLFVGRACARRALQRARRARRVVLVVDARPPRRRQRMAGDLARPCAPSTWTTTSSLPSTRAHTRSSTSADGTE